MEIRVIGIEITRIHTEIMNTGLVTMCISMDITIKTENRSRSEGIIRISMEIM